MTDLFRKKAPDTTIPETLEAAAPIGSARARAYCQAALQHATDKLSNTPDGQRNDALNAVTYSLARLLHTGGLTEADIYQAMRDASRNNGYLASDGINSVDNTIKSGIAGGRKDPRHIPDRPRDTTDDLDWINQATGEINPATYAEDQMFGATDTLNHIRTAARARLFGPWSVLGCVLAEVVAEIPPHVVLPPTIGEPASLNLFIGLVGGSSSGKSASIGIARDLLGNNLEARIIVGGTGEGVTGTFLTWDKEAKQLVPARENRALMRIDEIDQIGSIQSRQGSTLAPMMRSLWTGADAGQWNADETKRRMLRRHTYRLTVVAGIQPERAAVLLDDAAGGTPQRWTWLPAGDRNMPNTAPDWPGTLNWTPATYTATDIYSGRHELTLCNTARDYVIEQHRQRTMENADALDGHRILNRLKLAAALAILHRDTTITDEWWRLSGILDSVSIATREECRTTLSGAHARTQEARGRADAARDIGKAKAMAERVERAAETLARLVTRHADPGGATANRSHEPDAGCTRRCVTRAIRSFAGLDRDDVVDRAIADGLIVENGGRFHPGEAAK